VTASVVDLFVEAHHELRPRTPAPQFHIAFFAYSNVKATIRLRDGAMQVRISDLLEGAPPAVLSALAHILLAKIYRQPVARGHLYRYRKYLNGHQLSQQAHLVRQLRGRKQLTSPCGRYYDLEAIFEDLNTRYFHGLMARPTLTWSRSHARHRLGHYDPAHNAIVISRVFDDPRVPRYAVEYIVYHEMLHLRHPVKRNGARRCVHSAEFLAEEKLFPHHDRAQRFLVALASRRLS
jgi:hypothetical protein